jgi:hypothetical protein
LPQQQRERLEHRPARIAQREIVEERIVDELVRIGWQPALHGHAVVEREGLELAPRQRPTGAKIFEGFLPVQRCVAFANGHAKVSEPAQRSQDVRCRVDRCVIDDRDAVQQHEVMPDERLDNVGFVANVRGTEQPHDVGSFSAG